MRKYLIFSSCLMALLSGVYVFLLLLPDAVRLLIKQGWNNRPVIFLNIESVITYIIFALFSLLLSYEFFKNSPNYITTLGFSTLAASLLFYWLFFLLHIAAVSSI